MIWLEHVLPFVQDCPSGGECIFRWSCLQKSAFTSSVPYESLAEISVNNLPELSVFTLLVASPAVVFVADL